MVGITYVYIDTNLECCRFVDFFNASLLFSWKFRHDYLDTCCFGCLLCMCLICLYVHLFNVVEHVSHGKAV